MRVRVLFFGVLKDLAGRSSDWLDLPDGASVRDLLATYESRVPRLKESLPSLALAVNQQYAGRYTSIVRNVIDTQRIVADLKRGEDGAALVFEGVVRNRTRDRKTRYLDYEAYEEMALDQMEKLASQALQQFQVRDVAIVHRLGRLEIGETSVLIAVASAHRAAAFDACRWLIDTLKRTVPIWKKEHFEGGAVWSDGEPFPAEIPRANT
jgi:molybdopterin synthase catalytic subunit